jgi:hypothetical protein
MVYGGRVDEEPLQNDVYGYMKLKVQLTNNLELMGRTQINSYNLYRSEKFPYSATSYGVNRLKGITRRQAYPHGE